jgi:hydrogenase/urease accessory protein HupE
MGIEHILTGYDHLLFLLGLVLVGGPIRSLVGAITAFTLAHSITLGLAAFGIFTPSPRIVEPCIALSIAYVGIENWFARDAKGRWRVTFPFGLVHGFGFAGALSEVALSPPEIPTALFAFNLGVEIGQIAVLAMALPLVLLAHKKSMWERAGMRACTSAIALAGIVWFIARLRSSV